MNADFFQTGVTFWQQLQVAYSCCQWTPALEERARENQIPEESDQQAFLRLRLYQRPL